MVRNADKIDHDGAVIIKKYANRRLYNTQSSKYITLDFLADLTRKEINFKVIDAKTGDDITHTVLTQIIMEEESQGQNMLPVGFLRQLISLYGGSMQAVVPEFLESSLDNFRKNQRQVQDAIETVITSGPFGGIAKQNIEFVKAAREALLPGIGLPGIGAKSERKPGAKSDDLAELRRQMAELQARIDRMDKD